MRYLKIFLAFLALVAGAVATAMTNGAFHVTPMQSTVIMATAGFIGVLGYVPLAVSAAAGRILSAASGLLIAIQAAHAASVTELNNAHPWVWAGVGVVAILMGIVGKSPVAHVEPAAVPKV
jgi:hypothetical protein